MHINLEKKWINVTGTYACRTTGWDKCVPAELKSAWCVYAELAFILLEQCRNDFYHLLKHWNYWKKTHGQNMTRHLTLSQRVTTELQMTVQMRTTCSPYSGHESDRSSGSVHSDSAGAGDPPPPPAPPPSFRQDSPYKSIDESMTKLKGRSTIKPYMPMKPTKCGIKIWMHCDSNQGAYTTSVSTVERGLSPERVFWESGFRV